MNDHRDFYSDSYSVGYSDNYTDFGQRCVDVMRDILDNGAGEVEWGSTHRDLVELCVAVAATKEVKDERGFPLSLNELTRRAYHAVGATPPHHVAAIAYQIRNRTQPLPPLLTRIRRRRRDDSRQNVELYTR